MRRKFVLIFFFLLIKYLSAADINNDVEAKEIEDLVGENNYDEVAINDDFEDNNQPEENTQSNPEYNDQAKEIRIAPEQFDQVYYTTASNPDNGPTPSKPELLPQDDIKTVDGEKAKSDGNKESDNISLDYDSRDVTKIHNNRQGNQLKHRNNSKQQIHSETTLKDQSKSSNRYSNNYTQSKRDRVNRRNQLRNRNNHNSHYIDEYIEQENLHREREKDTYSERDEIQRENNLNERNKITRDNELREKNIHITDKQNSQNHNMDKKVESRENLKALDTNTPTRSKVVEKREKNDGNKSSQEYIHNGRNKDDEVISDRDMEKYGHKKHYNKVEHHSLGSSSIPNRNAHVSRDNPLNSQKDINQKDNQETVKLHDDSDKLPIAYNNNDDELNQTPTSTRVTPNRPVKSYNKDYIDKNVKIHQSLDHPVIELQNDPNDDLEVIIIIKDHENENQLPSKDSKSNNNAKPFGKHHNTQHKGTPTEIDGVKTRDIGNDQNILHHNNNQPSYKVNGSKNTNTRSETNRVINNENTIVTNKNYNVINRSVNEENISYNIQNTETNTHNTNINTNSQNIVNTAGSKTERKNINTQSPINLQPSQADSVRITKNNTIPNNNANVHNKPIQNSNNIRNQPNNEHITNNGPTNIPRPDVSQFPRRARLDEPHSQGRRVVHSPLTTMNFQTVIVNDENGASKCLCACNVNPYPMMYMKRN